MSKKPDGGPAFPAPGYVNQGMSLRDYFAAKAMEGMCSACSWAIDVSVDIESMAKASYEIADAMLAAREA